MVYCCFWWCFYTWVWSNHHISSLYLVWEMTCQFWGLWWQWVTVVFDDISIHQYGQIIIYHHCIWYGRWSAIYWGSGDAFKGNGLLLFLLMFQYIIMVICHHCFWYGRWPANFWGSGDAFWWVVKLVIRSSGHLVIWPKWSSDQYGQYGHLVIWSSGLLVIWSYGHMVIWSSDHMVKMFIWSTWSSGHLIIRSSGVLVIW